MLEEDNPNLQHTVNPEAIGGGDGGTGLRKGLPYAALGTAALVGFSGILYASSLGDEFDVGNVKR